MARAAIEKSDYDDLAMCPGFGERSSKSQIWAGKLAPNPSGDFCSIAFEIPTSATLLVSDLQGRVIKTMDVKEAYSYVLDVRDLVNGLYTVSIKGSEGRRFVGKLVVLH